MNFKRHNTFQTNLLILFISLSYYFFNGTKKMTRTDRITKKGLSYVKKRTKANNIKSSKLIRKSKADDVLAPDKPLVSSDDDIDDGLALRFS